MCVHGKAFNFQVCLNVIAFCDSMLLVFAFVRTHHFTLCSIAFPFLFLWSIIL